MSVKSDPVQQMRTTLVVSTGFDVARGPLLRDSLEDTSTPCEAIAVALLSRGWAIRQTLTHTSIEAKGLTRWSTQWDCQGHCCPDFKCRGPQVQLDGNALLCSSSSHSHRSAYSPQRLPDTTRRTTALPAVRILAPSVSWPGRPGGAKEGQMWQGRATRSFAGRWAVTGIQISLFCHPVDLGPPDPVGDSGLSFSFPSLPCVIISAPRSLSLPICFHARCSGLLSPLYLC